MSAPIDILFDAKCVAHNAAAIGNKKFCIVIMISLVRNPVIKLNRLCSEWMEAEQFDKQKL